MLVPVSAMDQPCLAVTVIYDMLQDVEMSGMCVGGAVISSQECVRAWLGLDGGVRSEETLTVSVSPLTQASLVEVEVPLTDSHWVQLYRLVLGMIWVLFDKWGKREEQWKYIKRKGQKDLSGDK